MAKRMPYSTLAEMERELGYAINSMTYPCESENRFYSDLRQIPNSIFEKTKIEFEEKIRSDKIKAVSSTRLPKLGEVQTIVYGEDVVKIRARNEEVFYNYTVDIHYGFGLDLPMLFTRYEVSRAMSVAKLQSKPASCITSILFKLPKELRNQIYHLAIPKGRWKMEEKNDFDDFNFSAGIADPSGFYFPLGKELSLLRVNRQMRQEALPYAYRRTIFHFDDIDDFIRFVVSSGKYGRDNIESLELCWESKADSELKGMESPDSEDNYCALPSLHVSRCIQLLKQCLRLKFLRLYFESDIVCSMSLDAYTADPGIRGLCSLRGVEAVEIWNLGYEPLQRCTFVELLKKRIETPKK